MLNDAQQIAAKFNEAFPIKKGKLSDQDIATACGVTKQAVNGWRSTGRIAKKHIARLADLSGKPLSFWLPNVDANDEFEIQTISNSEKKLISAFRSADDNGRAALLWVADQCLAKKAKPSIAEQIIAINPDTLASSAEIREKADAGRTL